MVPNLTEYHRPQTLDEALKLLHDSHAAPLAGGTGLLVTPNKQINAVVDLQSLDLRGIKIDDGKLRIGATTTLADIVESEILSGNAGQLLRDAAHRAGPNTYRNAATAGGLIASRPPVSELLTAWLVLDAQLELAGAEPASRPLADYFAGASAEGLIVGVSLAWPATGVGAAHHVARTPSDSPIVHVTAWAGKSGVRVAAGGMGVRTVRLSQVEQAVAAGLTEATVEAAVGAVEAIMPLTDFRGSAEYRRAMLSVLVRRALRNCMPHARR